jgi:BMFP domain-containing protein YqiC
MQTETRILDDLSRVAAGALSAFSGLRDEIEARMREQFERILSRMDLVPREEFEVVKAMVVRAREEQETLQTRLAALEARLADTAADAAPARKRVPKA